MPPNLLRLAYISEFLLALVAITEVWTEVGGPGHLDLIPWYTKLSLTTGLALMIAMGTVSAVAHQRAWNAKTLACLMAAVILIGVMAGSTYYAHLHENDDTDNEPETSVTRLQFPAISHGEATGS